MESYWVKLMAVLGETPLSVDQCDYLGSPQLVKRVVRELKSTPGPDHEAVMQL